MKNAALMISILVMASLCINGCGKQQDVDVTSSPEYNFSSFVGTTWKSKVCVAIAELRDGRTYLLGPAAFDPKHPKYNPPPNMHQISILPIGTHLRIERLMKDQGNWGGVLVVATLDDGTYPKNTIYLDWRLLADNDFLSPGQSLPKTWEVNPDLLESDSLPGK